ncbi:MAG: PilZ domain-containing protein [Planctomycetes bacterium]|nr:PilZ domain-containing protein [Planctomycetota bacterium]
MEQSHRGVDRRQHKRYTTAAAYWITLSECGRRLSAWMTDRSDGGAALLVGARHGLRIGDCVVLSGIYSADADVAENTPLVPRMARVLRIDDSQSDIRCVGLRFVTEINSGLKNSEPLRAGATGVAPMIVPLRLLGGTRPSLPVIDIYPAHVRQAAS